MIQVSKEQHWIIEKIVNDKKRHEFQNLLISEIIREYLKIPVIRWNKNISVVEFYVEKEKTLKVFQLMDILFLIKYLEDSGYVYLQGINNPKGKFYYTIDDNWVELRDEAIVFENGIYVLKSKLEEASFALNIERVEKIRTDIVRLLDRYASSVIYPSQMLVDYVDNNFKDYDVLMFEEQINDTQTKHEQAMRKAQDTLYWTRWAFFAALIPSLFNIYSFFTDMTIRELNSTIKERTLPEVINTNLTNDTIKAFVVDQTKDGKPMVNKQNAKK